MTKPALAQEHSPTSRAAAAAIEPVREPLKARVYRWITFMGSAGCTDEEACLALDMNPSTYRPRRVELVEQGSVVDSRNDSENQIRASGGGVDRQVGCWLCRHRWPGHHHLTAEGCCREGCDFQAREGSGSSYVRAVLPQSEAR